MKFTFNELRVRRKINIRVRYKSFRIYMYVCIFQIIIYIHLAFSLFNTLNQCIPYVLFQFFLIPFTLGKIYSCYPKQK